MGDGRRVNLWQDVWCGDLPLSPSSSFFVIATSKKAWAAYAEEVSSWGRALKPFFLKIIPRLEVGSWKMKGLFLRGYKRN